MAKENVTFQAVAVICNELTNAGVKPTVRKVNERVGGSFSTVSMHLKQWLTNQALAQSSENELSDEFNQALLAEFARVTGAVKAKAELQLAEHEVQLTEAIDLLATHELQLKECEKHYKMVEERAKAEQLELEKRLAAAIGDADSAKQREQGLQEKIDLLIEKCHQAELRAAIAETKIDKLTPPKSK